MKMAVRYVTDTNGKVQAVQLHISEWNRIVKRLKKYEQSLQLRSDLQAVLREVKSSKGKKQTLAEFLDQL